MYHIVMDHCKNGAGKAIISESTFLWQADEKRKDIEKYNLKDEDV